MSKHWNPKKSGWAGQWDRHRWPMPKRRGPFPGGGSRRRGGFSAGEIRLTILCGIALGLGATQAERLWPTKTGEPVAWSAGEPSAARPALTGAARVIDGDTFAIGATRIRIADIDTPEVNGRCAHENALAARATERLRVLLAQGPFELEPIPGRDEDRYGRKLRVVTRGGRSIGDQLVAEGLARTWSGRREPWC